MPYYLGNPQAPVPNMCSLYYTLSNGVDSKDSLYRITPKHYTNTQCHAAPFQSQCVLQKGIYLVSFRRQV